MKFVALEWWSIIWCYLGRDAMSSKNYVKFRSSSQKLQECIVLLEVDHRNRSSLCGIGADLIGSGGLGCNVAWHARQCSSSVFTAFSMSGNHTCSRRRAFVFACPWWPSWAICITCCWRDVGIIILVPRSNTLWWSMVISSFICLNGRIRSLFQHLVRMAARSAHKESSSSVALLISLTVS